MDPTHVERWLAVWERTTASLPICRAVLEQSLWQVDVALARLAKAEPKVSDLEPLPAALPEVGLSSVATDPRKILGHYKEVARKFHDVTPGTLPHSLCYVTERAISTESRRTRPRWDRHRFFLGSPSERGIAPKGSPGFGASGRAEAHHFGGFLRIEADVEPAIGPEADALLRAWDTRYVIEQLVLWAGRVGTRIAVELHGRSGWVTQHGPDDVIQKACGGPWMNSPTEVERQAVRALLDACPHRRANVADCGFGPWIEADLLRTERALVDVDLFPLATSTSQRVGTYTEARSAIDAAVRAANVGTLLLEVVDYRASGSVTSSAVLDRVLVEYGSTAIGPAWVPVSREQTIATWRAGLINSLANERPLTSAQSATSLVDGFVSCFEPDALFFRNGDDSTYRPVLGTTFEKGAAVLDSRSAGVWFVGGDD